MPDSPTSAPASTLIPRPVAPLDGALVDAAAAEFAWAPVPGADGYRLQIAPSPDFSYDVTEVEAGPTASLTLHDALPVQEADLYWRVGVAGAEAWSRPLRFRPATADAVAAHRAEVARRTAEPAKAQRRAPSEADLVPVYLRDDQVISARQSATLLFLFTAGFLAVIILLLIVGTTG